MFREQKVIDYSCSDSDQFGVVFRRVLDGQDEGMDFVRSAWAQADGSLVVDYHDVKTAPESVRGKRVTIPIGWSVSQYDGSGSLLRTIRAEDFSI